MTSNTSKLLLITGFLGSGKTTLLNRLLSLLEAKKVGVIVNEWGAMNIDASLIETKGEDQIVELSGGQIFVAAFRAPSSNRWWQWRQEVPTTF